MNTKDNLKANINAYKRIKKYANLIYDSADEDVKEIIIAICDQELKTNLYDLDNYLATHPEEVENDDDELYNTK